MVERPREGKNQHAFCLSVGREYPYDVRVLPRTAFSISAAVDEKAPVACGRNLGGRSATGDVLIFHDADVWLPRSFFQRFIKEFECRRLDIVCDAPDGVGTPGRVRRLGHPLFRYCKHDPIALPRRASRGNSGGESGTGNGGLTSDRD